MIQSNLYKTNILETTYKWLSWAGCCLMKHLHKTTTKQMWSLLADFQVFFFQSNICLNKDFQLHVLVPLLKSKNVLSYFPFWTYMLFLCNTGTKAQNVTFLTLRIIKLWHPQKIINFLPQHQFAKMKNRYVV